MTTRVYDLEGNHRRTTDDQADDVFVAAVEHASKREPVFVVSSTGHPELVKRVRAVGVDAFEDAILDAFDAAMIVAGTVDEWPELRKELDL